MVDEPGRTVLRRLLGKELRKLRESAGKTTAEAATWVGIKAPTISKIENGRQSIRPTNVRLLTQLYAITGARADELLERAVEAEKPARFSSYNDAMADWFSRFVDLEGDAFEISGYESELVPGLLQTADYVRAVTLAARPDTPESDLQRAVEFRQARQERVTGPRPPRLHFVLNEAVLCRQVGGTQVMRDQLRHLAQLSELPIVDLQVIPFSAGAHPAMGTTVSMLRFPDDEDLDFVYIETDRGAYYLEDPDDVERYSEILRQVQSLALDRAASAKMLSRVALEA